LQEYNKVITDRRDVIEAKLEDTVNAQKASAMQLSEHGVEIAMLRNDYEKLKVTMMHYLQKCALIKLPNTNIAKG